MTTPQESPIELSIVMPCLNEAETLGRCVEKARAFLTRSGVAGEIIVADNGSTDGSQEIARALGARVVPVSQKGYGSALVCGFRAARGTYIVMGDSDDSYDFSALDPFVEKLRLGNDLVMGNRFLGGIRDGAMPPLHRYLGNPVLSGIGRLFFHAPVGDFHCGLRGFSRDAVERLNLQSAGMELASEMVVKATLYRMRIAEVPIVLYPDGRSRPPHLRSWRDGWRHLRFMLIYSPRWLFLYPGLLLMLIGAIAGLWLLPSAREVGGVTLDVHTLLYASFAVLIGFQSVLFAVLTKVYGITTGFLPEDRGFSRLFRYVTLESGLIVGAISFFVGLAGSVYAVREWAGRSLGDLQPAETLRVVIPSTFFLMIGLQVILFSFYLSVLGVRRQ